MASNDPFDFNNDGKFFLLKTKTMGDLGSRDDNGNPIKFFLPEDIGVIQSTALLQGLNNSEFKTSSPSPNQSWINFISTGTQSVPMGLLSAQWSWTVVAGDNFQTQKNFASSLIDNLLVFKAANQKSLAAGWDGAFNSTKTNGEKSFDAIILEIVSNGVSQGGSITTEVDAKAFIEGMQNIDYTELPGGGDTSLSDEGADNIIDAINRLISKSSTTRDIMFNDPNAACSFDQLEGKMTNLESSFEAYVGKVFTEGAAQILFNVTEKSDAYSAIIQNYELISGMSFSGLIDTPSGHVSGSYLLSNGSGIVFTGIDRIAEDLIAYGFEVGGGSITEFTDLPDATENDGKIVSVGCDLYHSCDGEWVKILKEDTTTPLDPGDSDGLPGCVTTTEEKADYILYRDEVITENAANTFSLALQGLTAPPLHEACLFTEFQGAPDNSIKLRFLESSYKWAIATDSLLHPQVDNESPTANQIYTLNNATPYNQDNPDSMLMQDEFQSGSSTYPSQLSQMYFSPDGLRAVAFGYQSLNVHEYLFTEPYDLSTGTRSKFQRIPVSNTSGRLGVVKTNDPSIVYVYYQNGVERKTLDTPGDLYSIPEANQWYAINADANTQDSYFGHYLTWFQYGDRTNRSSIRYSIASMIFTDSGNKLMMLFVKNPARYSEDAINDDPLDKHAFLVSYDLETPYLLPGNLPQDPSINNQTLDEFLPEPSQVVELDSFGRIRQVTSDIFGGGKYVFLTTSNDQNIILEMSTPGDLSTIFTKGELQANPSAGYSNNKMTITVSSWPKDNLDLFMFAVYSDVFQNNSRALVSSTLSSPIGDPSESPCQFVEWKTSDQNLISNRTSQSSAEITFTQDLSVTGVFNCN